MKPFAIIAAAVFAAIASIPGAARADIESGLVAYLPFDGAAVDEIVNARSVTLAGSPAFVAAQPGFGKGMQIRANSNAGNVAVSGIWGSDFGTIALWYHASGPWYSTQTIWDNLQHENNFKCIITSSGQVSARAENNGSVANTATLNNLGGPDNWYHIVWTWGKSSVLAGNASSTNAIYINGVLSASGTNYFGNPHSTLNLGGAQSANVANNRIDNGVWDEVRVYNRALSAADVAELFAFMPPLPAPQNLSLTPGNNSFALGWDEVGLAEGYIVAVSNGATHAVSQTFAALPPFTAAELDEGVEYFFSVASTNEPSAAAWSAQVSGVAAAGALSSANDILSFDFGALGEAKISGAQVAILVYESVDVTALAPTYQVSPLASGDALKPSGATVDFTSPQTYTITAEDGSAKQYAVSVSKVPPLAYDFRDGLQGWAQIFPTPPPSAKACG